MEPRAFSDNRTGSVRAHDRAAALTQAWSRGPRGIPAPFGDMAARSASRRMPAEMRHEDGTL